MNTLATSLAILLTASTFADAQATRERSAWAAHGRLKVSENQRYLVHADGKPFFYLADTAWELFHRLDREEATRYLEDRARKGFTVIQAVALAELEGLTDPNPYGHHPLIDNDPTKPDVKDGADNDYWDHVDFIVAKAEQLGLVIGMLPTWGDKWNKKWGAGPEIFNARNSEPFGEWLGKRYADKPIIWILGGDRPVDSDQHKQITRAIAQGLKRGDGGTHLLTWHPSGGNGSADYFHDEDWLDFNMRQNGHVVEFTGRYDAMRADYHREPTKPLIDGEPVYEDHPVSFKAEELGHSVGADVRRAIYWNLFSGACGHTYGHHSVWQMFDPAKRKPINNPLMPWYEAIDQPGAGQMQHARWLMESRPFLSRILDETIIVETGIPTSIPGAGTRRFIATRDAEGSYAMVYAPVGRTFTVRMDALKAGEVRAWWFNPRNGEATEIGRFSTSENRQFTPPDRGELLDWVLVLDDAAKNYPAPGKR
jgi:hypothetical protein